MDDNSLEEKVIQVFEKVGCNIDSSKIEVCRHDSSNIKACFKIETLKFSRRKDYQ